MMIIGITGGIASGKSTLAGMLKNANVPVIDADELSQKVTAKGEPTLNKIIEVFGPDFLKTDGSLDRHKLGKTVFSDRKALDKLESIIHPAIKSLLEQELEKLRLQKRELVIYVAPLIFEKNLQNKFDQTILVVAPDKTMLARIIQRNGLSEKDAKQRMAAQLSTEEKMKLADHIIENNGTLDDLYKKLVFTWKNITGKNLDDQTK